MRQIHCPDRLIAMVNKGPYHAQDLFKLKRTQSRTEASLCFCFVRFIRLGNRRRHKFDQCVEIRFNHALFLKSNCKKEIKIKMLK